MKRLVLASRCSGGQSIRRFWRPAGDLRHTVIRAFAWRINAARQHARMRAAALWRPFLSRTVFIGVTGSSGKSTAKELLVAILSRELRGRGSHMTENRPEQVATVVRDTPRRDDFCVMELTATKPGWLDQSLALLRPTVGVVTTIGDDHLAAFGSREAIAREKARLVAALPAHGTAVLNADDPLVLAMRSRCAARVLTYGLSPDADVRADDASGSWPGRLQLTLVYQTERVLLRTQLCGTHWVSAVLAAVTTGVALGLSLSQCARGVSESPPLLARMQPVPTSDGVVFIRDDWKAPLWTVAPAFAFMRSARAPRKIIVVGTLSDYGGDASAQYLRVARQALDIAEHVVFVGPWASRVLRARSDRADGPTLRAFSSVRHASDYLNTVLRPGDLVLLKGTNRKDHLYRIILARAGTIECWRDDCGRHLFCDACALRSISSGSAPSDDALMLAGRARSPVQREEQPGAAVAPRLVIGLGNPGSDRAGTPHNIGHEVLDRLVETLDAAWKRDGDVLVARGQWKARPVWLVKLQTGVNGSGAGLRMLADRVGFVPSDCIVVHDDLDLPLGVVRTRMRGSAGGHRGVASILENFQTDAFRRVKVGIGRPAKGKSVVNLVLEPFTDEERAVVHPACAVAVERVLNLVST